MDIESRLAISYYEEIAVINPNHNIYLVRHRETGKVFVKKVQEIYNPSIYAALKQYPVDGTPRIIDFCDEENRLTLIEEYISGQSLEELIQEKRLTLMEISTITEDLCTILMRLHAFHPPIIHRDIKPSNVIITTYGRAVLLDFNAAKVHSNANCDTVLLGTQGYAAPEQYGFGSSSPQTDIYSLGILLKEMLAVVNTQNESNIKLLNHLNQIAAKCTQLTPADRFQSAGDLFVALKSITNTTKKSEPASRTEVTGYRRFLPPGFRTGTPWKMVVALLGYALAVLSAVSMQNDKLSSEMLLFEKIITGFMFLFLILASSNYLGIQNRLPLCRSTKPVVRILGVFIMDIVIALLMVTLMMIGEVFVLPAFLL